MEQRAISSMVGRPERWGDLYKTIQASNSGGSISPNGTTEELKELARRDLKLNSTGEHGLVASMGDLGVMNWYEAIDSESNGWYIPSINQLESVYITIGQGADNIDNFADSSYWSSTSSGSSSSPNVSKFNFANGSSSSG